MAHKNVKQWEATKGAGPRPCDWCGCPLRGTGLFIHVHYCPECKRKCSDDERVFYIQLGYDGQSDVTLPPDYEIHIPRG